MEVRLAEAQKRGYEFRGCLRLFFLFLFFVCKRDGGQGSGRSSWMLAAINLVFVTQLMLHILLVVS